MTCHTFQVPSAPEHHLPSRQVAREGRARDHRERDHQGDDVGARTFLEGPSVAVHEEKDVVAMQK
jgi:hypothetical protein